MAEEKPIVFVAEKGCGEIYSALALKYGNIELEHLSEAEKDPVNPKAELFIIDCGFSLERGLRALKKIKTAEMSVPIIFIAESFKDSAIEVFRAGARQFFVKPVNLAELGQTIEKLLSFRRSSRGKRAPLFALAPQARPESIMTSDKPMNLLHVIHFIEVNLTERITLQDLADRAGLSKFHFCRFFARHTGMTPMQYVHLCRVERAKSMIVEGNSTISSIAIKSGFNNVALFGKQFKKYTGQTPSLYRSFIRRRNLTWN